MSDLSQSERMAIAVALTCRGDVYAAVEQIIAEREAAAEVAGQMRHITAEMVRGDQPADAKEEFIADLRARLSHAEAERDHAWSQWTALSHEVRRRVPEPLLKQPPASRLLSLLTETPADEESA